MCVFVRAHCDANRGCRSGPSGILQLRLPELTEGDADPGSPAVHHGHEEHGPESPGSRPPSSPEAESFAYTTQPVPDRAATPPGPAASGTATGASGSASAPSSPSGGARRVRASSPAAAPRQQRVPLTPAIAEVVAPGSTPRRPAPAVTMHAQTAQHLQLGGAAGPAVDATAAVSDDPHAAAAAAAVARAVSDPAGEPPTASVQVLVFEGAAGAGAAAPALRGFPAPRSSGGSGSAPTRGAACRALPPAPAARDYQRALSRGHSAAAAAAAAASAARRPPEQVAPLRLGPAPVSSRRPLSGTTPSARLAATIADRTLSVAALAADVALALRLPAPSTTWHLDARGAATVDGAVALNSVTSEPPGDGGGGDGAGVWVCLHTDADLGRAVAAALSLAVGEGAAPPGAEFAGALALRVTFAATCGAVEHGAGHGGHRGARSGASSSGESVAGACAPATHCVV